MSVYMVLLALVPSPPYVAIRRRELLPRGFTLTLSGGLFSVTAFIRLLPSVLSTAGCPYQSGLSSEAQPQRKLSTPSRQRRQPRGAYGLHFVPTGDLLSFRLFKAQTRSRRLMPSWVIFRILRATISATEAFYLYRFIRSFRLFKAQTRSRRLMPSWVIFRILCATISATEAFYLYVNELFVSELALNLVVFLVESFHFLDKGRGDVFTMFVALR